MKANPGPGRFIVFEGLDGAGTTTQVELLARRLQQRGASEREVFVTHEPSDGPLGLQIRMVLAHRTRMDAATLAALFAADRVDHLYHVDGEGGIVAHLRAGVDVIADRYHVSSFAYQGMNLDWDWLWVMHAHCIRPDVTIFLDVPVEVCLRRIAAGRGEHYELFENKQALTNIRQSYLDAIDRLRNAGDTIVIVDGCAPPAQVHAAIWRSIQA